MLPPAFGTRIDFTVPNCCAKCSAANIHESPETFDRQIENCTPIPSGKKIIKNKTGTLTRDKTSPATETNKYQKQTVNSHHPLPTQRRRQSAQVYTSATPSRSDSLRTCSRSRSPRHNPHRFYTARNPGRQWRSTAASPPIGRSASRSERRRRYWTAGRWSLGGWVAEHGSSGGRRRGRGCTCGGDIWRRGTRRRCGRARITVSCGGWGGSSGAWRRGCVACNGGLRLLLCRCWSGIGRWRCRARIRGGGGG